MADSSSSRTVAENVITRSTRFEELPELLRVEEAAAYLGVGRTLIYQLANDGALPAVRLGRLVRIKRDGLLAQIEAGR